MQPSCRRTTSSSARGLAVCAIAPSHQRSASNRLRNRMLSGVRRRPHGQCRFGRPHPCALAVDRHCLCSLPQARSARACAPTTRPRKFGPSSSVTASRSPPWHQRCRCPRTRAPPPTAKSVPRSRAPPRAGSGSRRTLQRCACRRGWSWEGTGRALNPLGSFGGCVRARRRPTTWGVSWGGIVRGVLEPGQTCVRCCANAEHPTNRIRCGRPGFAGLACAERVWSAPCHAARRRHAGRAPLWLIGGLGRVPLLVSHVRPRVAAAAHAHSRAVGGARHLSWTGGGRSAPLPPPCPHQVLTRTCTHTCMPTQAHKQGHPPTRRSHTRAQTRTHARIHTIAAASRPNVIV